LAGSHKNGTVSFDTAKWHEKFSTVPSRGGEPRTADDFSKKGEDIMIRKSGLMWLVVANVLCYCVLSFYQTVVAQSSSRPTLANPVESRSEMNAHLEEIKNLLKEQNLLLKSGQVKVIVTELPKN
jgi:hypothetical protein